MSTGRIGFGEYWGTGLQLVVLYTYKRKDRQLALEEHSMETATGKANMDQKRRMASRSSFQVEDPTLTAAKFRSFVSRCRFDILTF